MTDNQNAFTTRELIDSANLQIGFNEIPSKLASSIVPVIDINPNHNKLSNILKSVSFSNASASVVYVVPSTRDLYITGAFLSVIKDVTATSTATQITVVPDGGVVTAILSISGITLTPQNNTQSLSLNFPLKIQRGSTIYVTNTTSAGNVVCSGGIIGILV